MPGIDGGSDTSHADNVRYAYSPLPERPALRWPNGARIALWLVPNIEHFRFDRPQGAEGRAGIPDVPSFAQRDYGSRVGIWRLIDVLDKYGLRASVALNSDVCRFYPQIIRAGEERGWEWMGHGKTNSERLQGLGMEDEREVIRSTIRTIMSATGHTPVGWLGPGLQESYVTPDLLAEAGVRYVCDWPADEQPFPMRVRQGRLVALPVAYQIADLLSYHRGLTADQHYRVVCEHFDALYEDAETSGRMMGLPLHSYVSGLPGPARWLDKSLSYIMGHKGVWATTGAEIADWYYDHYYTDALARSEGASRAD